LDALEQFNKNCNRAAGKNEVKKKTAVFLGFGFVSAQLQGCRWNLRLRQSLAKNPKILAPHRLQFLLNRSRYSQVYAA
jgi:hypothetical protein